MTMIFTQADFVFSVRRCFLMSLAFFLAGSTLAWSQTYNTLFQRGPSSNRVDIVFVGDGYRANEIETTYVGHIQNYVNYMFGGQQHPFPRYEQFFNVHRVNVVSNESGADKPPEGVFVDTALDASYWWDGTTERLLYLNTSKANSQVSAALNGTGIDVDIRFGTVNDTKYGGGGGSWAVYAGANSAANEVALHEVGHSFAGLADEYFYTNSTYSGGEPSEPNVTRSPSTGKWDRWLGYDDPRNFIGPIDYYEGARYHEFGIYRPSFNSKMRALNRPFDAVSREQFINRIYDEVDPLDDWTTNTTTLFDPSEIEVATVDDSVIEVEWSLDGQPLFSGGTTLTLADHFFSFVPGSYTLEARAYDTLLDHAFTGGALDWWRLAPNKLEQRVSWTIEISGVSGDFDENGVYDCTDIDALVDQIIVQSDLVEFDLTGDGQIDLEDLDAWLVQAGFAQSPTGEAYLYGDANLDGAVDASDFNVWNSNKFTSGGLWCGGDFNADGAVDASDFNVWNSNKFGSSFGAIAVPEPAGAIHWLLLLLGVGHRYRRRP